MNDDEPENEEYWHDDFEYSSYKKICEYCDAVFTDQNSYDRHHEQNHAYHSNLNEDSPSGKIDKELLKRVYMEGNTLSRISLILGNIKEIKIVRYIRHHKIDVITGREIPATTKQIDFLKNSEFWTFQSVPHTIKIASAFITVVPPDNVLRHVKKIKDIDDEIPTHDECMKIIDSQLDAPESMIEELVSLGFKHYKWGQDGPVELNRWEARKELQKLKPSTEKQLKALKKLKMDYLDIKNQFDASQMISFYNNIQYRAAKFRQENFKEYRQ